MPMDKLNGQEIFHVHGRLNNRKRSNNCTTIELHVTLRSRSLCCPVIPVFSVNEYWQVISVVCFSRCSLDEQHVHISTDWY